MRGSITQRGPDTWRVRYDAPDENGKRRQVSETVHGKKRDAQRVLRERLASVDNGLPPTSSKETVSEFLDRWLKDHVAHTTKPRTHQFYQMMARLYIRPVIGGLAVQKLKPGDIQRVVSFVLDQGLSPTTARRAYATIHRALECAMKWGTVYRNVCDAIDAPREADREITPPDKATVLQLLAKAMETPYGAAIWVLTYTGMRRGEVCALRWEHVNMDTGTLSIAGAVGRQDGKLTVTPPKSKASRRMIYLDDQTVAVFRRHRAAQAEYRLEIGSVYQDQGLVFPSPTGKLLDPDILTKTWQQIRGEEGKKYRLHDLRHAHATFLLESGTHLKVVQQRLGHSSITITADTYAHVSPGMDKEAANAFANTMGATP